MKLNGILFTAILSLSAISCLLANPQTTENLPGVSVQPVEYFYTGKPYDSDLGAYAFKYRNYDPRLVRWTSSDPSGFPDGANNGIYAPVPTYALDALGLETETYVRSETEILVYKYSDPSEFSLLQYYLKIVSMIPIVGEALTANELRGEVKKMTGTDVPDDIFDPEAFLDAYQKQQPREGWSAHSQDWDFGNWSLKDGPEGPAPDYNKKISETFEQTSIHITFDLDHGGIPGQYMRVSTGYLRTVVTE